MESIIYGQPILHHVLTLKSLMTNFITYTEPQVLSDEPDEVQYEATLRTIDLIKGSMSQIDQAITSLQAIINKMKENYDNTKNKQEKKSLLQEAEKIEQETHFNDVISEATQLHFMLGTRLTEATSNRKKLERKLGVLLKPTHSPVRNTQKPSTRAEDMHSIDSDPYSAQFHEQREIDSQQTFSTRALLPPRANLPQFSGNEEEFPEFWAIYETLVHKNPTLTVIEKMLLLKECLKGKSDRSIRGIQLLPQNYDWMIETLHKKYGNRPANRARIIQQLNDLQKASNTAGSCEFVYDNICMLLNQMFSTGHDVRSSSDALWTEAILSKFPRDIVEPILTTIREHDNLTVDALMDFINHEIAAKAYIHSRFKANELRKNETTGYTNNTPPSCAICERSGHHTRQCQVKLSVNEKRSIVSQKRLCWKCYSSQHSSVQCFKNNCPLCGRMHHIKLCFLNSNTNETASVARTYPKQNTSSVHKEQQHEQRHSIDPTSKRTNELSNISRTTSSQQRKNHNISVHVERAKNCDHFHDSESPYENKHNESEKEITENHTNIEANTMEKRKEQIVLMTAEGRIWNHDTEQFEKAIFFFDTGAQKTIIQEDLAMKLRLPKLTTERCIMSGIGGKTETFQSTIVNLKISTAYGRNMEILIQTKPILTNGFPSVKLCSVDQEFLEKRNLLVCNPNIRGEHHVPQILVGLDYYYNFVHDDGECLKTPTGLRIAKTIFGPTVYGRGFTDSYEHDTTPSPISYSMSAVEENESEILRKLFELEGMGICSDESTENPNFLDYFRRYSEQILIENGIVTAPFPLKNTVDNLADNYSLAFTRLRSLQLYLEKNIDQRDWYCRILSQYETDDIIERVHERAPNSVGLYYMPHSGVWRPKKPKPLRIVFDASSKRKGQLSLNDVTHKGEALVNKIHDILITSRTSKIIMLCDIEAAFTQIRLQENHRDLCRFLWLKDTAKPPSEDNIIEYRFKRVPFGVKPSPSILNMCLLAFLESKNSALSKEIIENLYVDNILLCANNPSEALQKYTESKELLAEIGMNLREYISNSDEVNSSIPYHDRAHTGNIKLLGVTFNTKADQFSLTINLPEKTNLTKRDIVSQINSIYDPIGIVGPLTVRLKHLMREIYDSGIEWKDPVPKQLAELWNKTCKEMNNVTLSVPRYFFDNDAGPFTLWIFADASAQALAACAFFRNEHTLKVTPLTSGKTRLTPKRIRQTIPKLELLAILMAIRLGKTIVAASKKPTQYLHILSDSDIALSWITGKHTLPVFVENQKCRIIKVKETIELKGTPVNFWYVPTKKNPADAGTRGTDVGHLQNLPWILGPQWLGEQQNPCQLKIIDETDKAVSTDKQKAKEDTTVLFLSQTISTNTRENRNLFTLSRFSSLEKAIRTVTRVCKITLLWVIRVNSRVQHDTFIHLKRLHKFSPHWNITSEDFTLGEITLLADTHKSISLQDLQKRFPQKKLFRDEEGIIRNRSRLQHSVLPHDTKNPIYVEDPDLTRLILNDIHLKNAHSGKDHTLCLARGRYWIPRPSGSFRRIVKQCVTCRKWQALPFGAPEMPALPEDRVILTRPFEKIGCDFMGPFPLKGDKKCYICLYTCLTTRALHLELVEDMSATAFLNSFKRFASRRGIPKLVRTDCGSNFKLGQRIIETMFQPIDNLSETCVMSYCAQHKIQWIFNPPGAPWMGGAWERLVGTVKRSFYKAVGRKRLTYSEFLTIITEIEGILNTRPLTACSANVEQIPLRPVDFLQKSLQYTLPPLDNDEIQDPSYDPQLIQSITQAKEALQNSERVSETFWQRWHLEYLTALREMQMIHRKQSRHQKLREPKLNEIVLVEQENLPRGSWCYGKVVELIRSSDDMVRSVKILMPNKNIWHRPLSKIYPLEISAQADTYTASQSRPHRKNQSPTPSTTAARPQRVAKLKALQSIKDSSDTTPTHKFTDMNPLRDSTVLLMTTVMLISLLPQTLAFPDIRCRKDSFLVIPPQTEFQLCIRNTCRLFSPNQQELMFQIPPTTRRSTMNISLNYLQKSTSKTVEVSCAHPPVCDVSQSLLSKNLLGNPHCWPTGALISISISAYLIIATVILIGRFVHRRLRTGIPLSVVAESHDTESIGNSSLLNTLDESNNKKMSVERPLIDKEISLATFHPMPLGRAVATAIVILCAMTDHIASTCQLGYSRHHADLICTSKHNCSIHFSREILFNAITNSICIDILHANKSFGIIQVERLPTERLCSKRTLFFTRATTTQVYSATRCAQMGSCMNNTCSQLQHNSEIPELSHASIFPGYSGCEPSCGGLLCGCLLPLSACSFYRIAHVPTNEAVYEVVKCMEWRPNVRLRVNMSFDNREVHTILKLKPYVSQKVQGVSFSVVSITKPTCPLLTNRYAIAQNEVLLIPEQLTLPVTCTTFEEATTNFRQCTNHVVCDCDKEVSPARCTCPQASIDSIRADSTNIFPISSPFVSLAYKNRNIVALSTREEMTVSIESEFFKVSAEYVTQQDCKIFLHSLTGCYSCQEGASLVASCHTALPAWITLECDSHAFSVECDPSNKSSTVSLDFETAVVNQKCKAKCSDKTVNLSYHGVLEYLPHNDPEQIFRSHSSTWKQPFNWNYDWKIPDISPLFLTIKKHWKTTTMLISTVAFFSVATYFFGPLVIIAVIRLSYHLLHLLLQLAWFITFAVSKAFVKMISFIWSNTTTH